MIIIPDCCTSSTIALTTEADYHKYKDDPQYLDFAIKNRDSQTFGGGQPLSLNLTWLKDGNYIAMYLADLGGLIKIVLTTE